MVVGRSMSGGGDQLPSLAGLSLNIGIPRCDPPYDIDNNPPYNWADDIDRGGRLRIQRVKGDGSCFFHSLSYLLPYPSIPPKNPNAEPSPWSSEEISIDGFDLRNIVLDHMATDWKWYAGQIDDRYRNPGENDEDMMKRYIRHYRNTVVNAGQVEAEAAAEVLNAEIVILSIARFENYMAPDANGVMQRTGRTYVAEENAVYAHVYGRAWPCVKIGENQYRAMTREEADDIPTYILLWHHPSPDGSVGPPHYSPIQRKEDYKKSKKRRKETDIDTLKQAKCPPKRDNVMDELLAQNVCKDGSCHEPVPPELAEQLLRIVAESERNAAPQTNRGGGDPGPSK